MQRRYRWKTPHVVPDQRVKEGGPDIQGGGKLEKRGLELNVMLLGLPGNWEESDVASSPQDVNVDDGHCV